MLKFNIWCLFFVQKGKEVYKMKRNRARKTFFDWDVNMVAKNQIDNTGFDVMDYLNKGKKNSNISKKEI